MKLKQFWLLMLFGLLAASLSACSSVDEHLWLQSPGWSRAVLLGNSSAKSPVPIAIAEDGDIYTVLFETDQETYTSLNLVHFASQTGTKNLLPLNISVQRPSQINMLWEDDALRLYWIDSENLHTAKISIQGDLLEEARSLSEDIVVGSYSLALHPNGETSIWYGGTRKNPGIYALSEDGTSTQIDTQGVFIRTMFDANGKFHAAWVHYPYGYETSELRYAAYRPGDAIEPGKYVRLQRLPLGTSTTLDDFTIGLDQKEIIFIWTTNVRSGLQAGTIRTTYIHFPIDRTSVEQLPQDIWVPTIYSLDFIDMPGGFNVGPRVPLKPVNFPAVNELQDLSTNPFAGEEMVLAFRSPAQHLWRKTRLQVNLAYFRDGEPFAYQPLSFTATAPSFPNVVSKDNYLYVTWLEKQEDNWHSVYLASTEPGLIDVLDDLTAGEIGNIVLESAFGMLIGVLLAPIAAAVWMFAPFLVMLIFSPLGRIRSEKLSRLITLLSIIISIGTVWFVKLAIFPAMFTYVPFSAWVPEISASVGLFLRILYPALTLFASAYLAWHFTYRQGNYSSLYFMLIYVGVDALFTTAIYAVLIYGTFIQ
ncbi:MAG: hypothetical protein Kow002_13510 [Anaerolineales bacterium]